MKKILFALLFIVLTIPTYAQLCERGVIDCVGECGRFYDADGDGICDISPRTVVEIADHSSSYWLWQITLGILLAYLISAILVRFKVWKKVSHRKLWNLLLAITFLVSGIIGLLLVIVINYQIDLNNYFTWLVWHVNVGIGMAIISLIHLIWHWSYYMNLFKKKSH